MSHTHTTISFRGWRGPEQRDVLVDFAELLWDDLEISRTLVTAYTEYS